MTHSFLSPWISLAITGIGGGIWETRFGKSFVECAWRTVAERARCPSYRASHHKLVEIGYLRDLSPPGRVTGVFGRPNTAR